MIRRPPRSTLDRSSAASDVYKRQARGPSVTEREPDHDQTDDALSAGSSVDPSVGAASDSAAEPAVEPAAEPPAGPEASPLLFPADGVPAVVIDERQLMALSLIHI